MAKWAWLAAALACLVAVAVAGVAASNRQAVRRPATVVDTRNDVFGTAPPHLTAALDLAGATMSPLDGGYRVVIRLAHPLDRSAIADRAVVYAVRMESAGGSYMARTVVSGRRTDASVVDSRTRERPFVISPPRVDADRVVVQIPRTAVRRLGATFSWGVIAESSGSQDTAPSDLAARYPG